MGFWLALFIVVCLVLTLAALGVVAAGYHWGGFAAAEVMRIPGAKWKAYVVALLPAASFSAAFHFDRSLAVFAGTAFFAIALAAVFGCFVRWNVKGRIDRSSFSSAMPGL
ncbi:MAG: hypothetical protein R2729_09845 [Bryobacteraceae bacterium]